ncbi:MAG: Bax inhibitor-1/YccA family protein [Candidatus Dormibacteraeota bacterium]|nr:Bax inhibitor-1/YccA family protein [Candidatus Dormibacteraeota bacterium]
MEEDQMYDPNQPTGMNPGVGRLDVAGRQTSLLDAVLGWLALSLVLTAGGVYGWEAMGLHLPWFVALVVMIALIFGIQAAVRAGNTALGASLFAAFAVAEGLFLAPVIDLYLRVNPAAVGNAVLGTAAIFVLCAGVVWVTNRSFAAWGKWLLGALLAGIVLIAISIFIPAIGIPQLLLDLFLGAVFVGLTLFDFWRVKAARPGDDSALLIALSLYLDFINLFLILLRLFGRRD